MDAGQHQRRDGQILQGRGDLGIGTDERLTGVWVAHRTSCAEGIADSCQCVQISGSVYWSERRLLGNEFNLAKTAYAPSWIAIIGS